MIASLTGKITSIEEGQIEVETSSGIGFKLLCTMQTASAASVGETVKFSTYLQVREDSMILFAFSDAQEKSMFEKLITISGIGPKMALSILSGTTPAELAITILSSNVAVLSSIKGVGKKTAERIILELKEKVTAVKEDKMLRQDGMKQAPEVEDAIFTLRALGLRVSEAEKMVQRVASAGMTAEEIITKSLKGMAK